METINSKPYIFLKKTVAIFLVFIFTSWTIAPYELYADIVTTEGGTIDVTQDGDTTNWNVTGNPIWNVDEFNIPEGSIYNILGLTASASLALLVNGSSPSDIFGSLNLYNIDFILQNIYGINIGENALINIDNSSFIASTLAMNLVNTDFLNHQYEFEGEGGLLTNAGHIEGHNTSLVALVANAIENKGTIEVPLGTIALAAGELVTIGVSPDGMVSLGVDKVTACELGLLDQIKNTGTISSEGGKVILNAQAVDGLFRKAINLASEEDAVSFVLADNGEIEFKASGDIESRGILRAGAFWEHGASFVAGGVFEVGHAYMDNLDGRADFDTGNYSGIYEDSGDINIVGSAVITLIGNSTFWADSDPATHAHNGQGVFTMAADSSIVGGGYNLTLYSAPLNAAGNPVDSVLEDISGVNRLELHSTRSGDTATFASDASDTFSITTMKTVYGSVFERLEGTGAALDPYLIFSVSNAAGGLQYIPTQGMAAGTYYEMANNIDASETSSWNSGDGFDPIGDDVTAFSGNFDGISYVISGITIDRPSETNVGLFGYTDGAVLENTGLLSGFVTGGIDVGGLVGAAINSSSIVNCYTTGDVTGTTRCVGGLVGYSNISSTIDNSYATGNVAGTASYVGGIAGAIGNSSSIDNSYATGGVAGTSKVGGLVGRNWFSSIDNSYAAGNVVGSVQVGGLVGNNGYSSIDNSYATGTVTGVTAGTVGGLIGYDVGAGTLTNNWWFNNAALGVGSGEPGAGKVDKAAAVTDFFDPTSAVYLGDTAHSDPWDIASVHDGSIWGMSTRHGAYPMLQFRYSTTIEDEYQLQLMYLAIAADYTLANNIDASETASWNSGLGFEPVGNDINTFAGSFNGGDYAISGLLIDRPSEFYVGLFGYTQSAAIQNVGLIGGSTTGNDSVGGLVGFSGFSSSVTNCCATGSVTGTIDVGGLVGYNHGYSSIDNSYATGDVSGTQRVGGLVGYAYTGGPIEDSYATGDVTGTSSIGGLVGYSGYSSIDNSYATGDVTGTTNVGGLVGQNYLSSDIDNSYATGTVTGVTAGTVGGLIGFDDGSGTLANNWWFNNASLGVGSGEPGAGQVDKATAVTDFFDPTSDVYLGDTAHSDPWDIASTHDGSIWGMSGRNTSYPMLQFRYSTTITDVYQLQLMYLALAADYTLASDIDATETAGWNSGRGFEPIGRNDALARFTGTFDGGYYRITGLTIDRPTEDFIGLFGYTNGATIQNVGLIGGSVTGVNNVGYLAGENYNNSSIANVYASGDVNGIISVGGLVGYNASYSSIDNSYATGNVTGTARVGGLVGGSGLYSSIDNSYAAGDVAGTADVGGLAGWMCTYSTIDNSYATGDVTGATNVGGLAGINSLSSDIDNSYATGSVTGVTAGTVGGLIGFDDGSGTLANNWWFNNASLGVGSGEPGAGQVDKAAAVTDFFDPTSDVYLGDTAHSDPWDIASTHDGSIWGMSGRNTSYPMLQFRYSTTITDVYQLQLMYLDLTADYTLVNNIDASETASWNSGLGFEPVGNAGGGFTGAFYGGYYKITGLTIDRSNEDNVGLFGYAVGATIQDIGLTGVSVTGGAKVGSLAGYNSGYVVVDNCYATGDVTGTEKVGGLVGWACTGSSVEDSYATCDVTGTTDIGGLVGQNYGSPIDNSYATGSVMGTTNVGGMIGFNRGFSSTDNSYATGNVTGNTNVGGLVGRNGGVSDIDNSYATGSVTGTTAGTVGGLIGFDDGTGTLTNNWWFNNAALGVGSGEPGAGEVDKAAAVTDFFDPTSAVYLGDTAHSDPWDIASTHDGSIWGMSGRNTSYPMLQFRYSTTITDVYQLQLMYLALNADYTLANDIDASETINWNSGLGFEPVGYEAAHAFKGSFSGADHVITGLTVDRPNENYVGLFGRTYDGATIQNVGLAGGSVAGDDYVGGLAGYNGYYSSVDNSYATGNVTGANRVGGLVGFNGASSISNSYAKGDVTGANYVGGLVGYNNVFATIDNSYATGSVTGTTDVGGLVGWCYSGTSIDNSYSIGDAAGTTNVGGLVGHNGYSDIDNSYATGTVTGVTAGTIGGLIGVDDGTGTLTNNWWFNNASLGVGSGEPGAGEVDKAAAVTDFFDPTSAVYLGDTAHSDPWDIASVHDGSVWGMSTRDGAYPMFQFRYATTITDAYQLQLMYLNLNVDYTLANDIDATETAAWNPWNDGLGGVGYYGFEPIGDNAASFTGTFDGVTYAISGLTINRPDENYVGLFGYTNFGATIERAGLLGGSIVGLGGIGGIVGGNIGSSISNSFAAADITGTGSAIGGLVGYNAYSSSIDNCYATGDVTGSDKIGGLVGYNYVSSTIDNSYSTGNVKGATNAGGFVGKNDGTITNCFATGELLDGSGDISVTTTGFVGTDAGGTYNNDWFFNSSTDGFATKAGSVADFFDPTFDVYTADATTWDIAATKCGFTWAMSGRNTSYPILQWHYSTTINDVYQLQLMFLDLGANYTLANDIDASDTARWNHWNDGLGNEGYYGFESVGVYSYPGIDNPYTGTFNGGSHTITGLTIDRPDEDYIGLFGYTNGATIENVGLAGGSVTGADSTGGLVGYNLLSAIDNCYSTGDVTGTDQIGGLVGQNQLSSINDSYAAGDVTGTGNAVGGLVGYNNRSPISNSYAEGNAAGINRIGGLVGHNRRADSAISDSYATGDATGTDQIGGLVGYSDLTAPIDNCYATGDVTGTSNTGGFVGASDATITNCFATGELLNTGNGFVGTDNGGTYTNDWFYNTAADSYASKADAASDFYKPIQAVYDIGGANQWDIFTPVWDTFTAEYPHLHWEGYTGADANYVWSGDVSATWATAANWTTRLVPDADSFVYVFDRTFDPVTAAAVTAANFGIGSGSLTLGDSFTVTGDVDISGGTLNAAGFAMDIGGDWTHNGGIFTHGDNTVTLSGADQHITGDNTFFNLTKTVGAADTLTFEADKTQTFEGTLTLKGSAAGRLSLRSNDSPTQWKLTSAAVDMEYLDVKDSNNIGAVINVEGKNCSNSLNNLGWILDSPAPPPSPSLSPSLVGMLANDALNGILGYNVWLEALLIMQFPDLWEGPQTIEILYEDKDGNINRDENAMLEQLRLLLVTNE